MNTGKMIITLDDLVVEFAANYSLGMKAVKAAAETYATALRKFPKTAEAKFRARFPEIRTDTWKIFEDIGNDKLPPQAILMNPGAVAHLREAKIPAAKCAAAAGNRVAVVNPATGKPNDVPFTHLTESQAVQVFNPKTHQIRTEAEQKRFLTRATAVKRVTNAGKKTKKNWYTESGVLIVKKACRITLEELHAIVASLERSSNTGV